MREKRLLQAAVLVAGLVPTGSGLAGVLLGPEMAGSLEGADAALNSHFRYLSGLLLGLGLCFWSLVPKIERRAEAFRLLTVVVVVGGLGRAWGLVSDPDPGEAMRLALVMELVVTPALCLWQARVARRG